ncbi:MAG: prepilin peptidase, partial [Chloroflexi bacterium]|nr:prepilin peptidase [Chloroflexota bacterium]
MGMGDVKLAALMGAATGFPAVFVALLLGIVLGGLTAAFLVLFGIRKRKDFIPFGPFLSLATMATLVWGDDILRWYAAMF